MTEDNKIIDHDFIGPDRNSDEYKYLQAELKLLQRNVNRAGNFLFAIGLITIISNVVLNFDTSQIKTMIYYCAIGGFYIGMGVVSTFRPIIAIALSLTAYIGLFSILIISNQGVFNSFSIMVRIIVVTILVVGLVNSIKIRQLKSKFSINE